MKLSVGQVVRWPPSAVGFAQIEDLMRTRVRLIYQARTGRVYRPVVSASRIEPLDGFLFPNPMGRGIARRSKEFTTEAQRHGGLT